MYAAMRYESDSMRDKTPDLERVPRVTRDGEPNLGNLCVLLRWGQTFPVTQQERDRHATVVRFQGSRIRSSTDPIWRNESGAGCAVTR